MHFAPLINYGRVQRILSFRGLLEPSYGHFTTDNLRVLRRGEVIGLENLSIDSVGED